MMIDSKYTMKVLFNVIFTFLTFRYLVERLSTRPLATEYNPNNQQLKFVSSSEISRKYDEDRCPLGFKLDKKHQHCTG